MAVDYPPLESVVQTDTFEEWRVKTNDMIAHAEASATNIGNLNFLNTVGTSLVGTSLVDAINSTYLHADTNTVNIGNMNTIDNKIKRTTIVDTLNQVITYLEGYTNTIDAASSATSDQKIIDIQKELDDTQISIGLSNTVYSAPSSSNYLNTSTNVVNASLLLDEALGKVQTLTNNLADTLGADTTSGTFDFTGESINYLVVDENGNADVKLNLIELDKKIKESFDAVGGSDSVIGNQGTVLDTLITSVGANANGQTTAISNPNIANSAVVMTNIGLIDAELGSLDARIDLLETDTSAATSNTDLRNVLRSLLFGDTSTTAFTGISYSTSTDVKNLLNDLYNLIKPMLDDYNAGGFVKKTGDTMTGELILSNTNLKVQGTQNNLISSTGDIIAYQGS